MKLAKKIFKSLLVTFAVLLLSSPIWISKIPLNYITFLIGKSSIIDQQVCNYSIQVGGDSMSPLIPQGSSIKLNRCFSEADLTEGMVILFNKNSEYHLSIIRHILPLNPPVYKISNEKPNERLQDIIREEVIAIGKNIDTSSSVYKPPQDLDSFILNANDYVSKLYLGKIPRGYGEEMAEVEKTTTFFKDQDKFCMVVAPKKELVGVNTEIVNDQTKKVIISHKNIIFNLQPNPNTNCQDFGSEPGMLDLSQGNYHYRFLLNHQALADIPFTVE